jgi:hypothetical protein
MITSTHGVEKRLTKLKQEALKQRGLERHPSVLKSLSDYC